MPSFKIIGLPVLEKKIFSIYNFIELESPMLNAKFQDHRTSGSGEEDFLRFLPYMGMAAWSCDLDHLYKLSFPLPKEAPHKIWL